MGWWYHNISWIALADVDVGSDDLLVYHMHRYNDIVFEKFLYKNGTLVTASDRHAHEHQRPQDFTNSTKLIAQARQAMGRRSV